MTTSTRLGLKPCPFCGETSVDLILDTDAYVFCASCGTRGPLAGSDGQESKEEFVSDVVYAVTTWNEALRPHRQDPSLTGGV